VSSGLSKDPTVDAETVMQQLQADSQQKSDDKASTTEEKEDPMKRMLESMQEEKDKRP
jgi:hypothetical protein